MNEPVTNLYLKRFSSRGGFLYPLESENKQWLCFAPAVASGHYCFSF